MPTPDPVAAPKPPAPKPAAKKAPAKKAASAKPAASAGSSAAPGVSAADWNLVQQVASQYGIDPYVLVAIGMHETGWGTQGAGRQGYTLGVGVPDTGGPLSQYQGLQQQLQGAAQILQNYGVHTIQDLATGVLAPHNGQVRYASGSGWTQGVVASYDQIKGTKFTAKTSTASSGGTSLPGAVGNLGTSQPLTVQQYLDDPSISAQYGYLSAFLKDPEIGPIIAKAAQQGWGENELLGALSQTKWWKTTSDSARAWQAQQKLDPASAKQRLGTMLGQIQQQAQQTLGSVLNPKRASQLANLAISQGWTQAQLQAAIGAEFHYNANQTAYGGLAGQTLSRLKAMGSEWLVPISDGALADWTKSILEGNHSTDDFTNYLQAQAKSLYPTLSKAIDSGTTVKQYLDPYGQLAAQTGVVSSPNAINWMDPKWSKALNTTTPDGQRAPMSLSDWGMYLRGLPEYQNTDQARASAASLGLKIAQTFGEVAP